MTKYFSVLMTQILPKAMTEEVYCKKNVFLKVLQFWVYFHVTLLESGIAEAATGGVL